MTAATGRRVVVLSIHDVAPATLGPVRRLRAVLTEAAGHAPASLLVVPRMHGADDWDARARAWVLGRAATGDEIVLHGLVHADARGRDGAEFRRGTETDRAARAIGDGRAVLGRLGLAPRGFVAPAYGHPAAVERALRDAGLDWWATRGALRSPRGTRRLPSVGLGASTPARRALSPAAAALAARLLARAPAVRLDLHPADLAHPRLAAAVPGLLDELLVRQGRRPVRHADLLP